MLCLIPSSQAEKESLSLSGAGNWPLSCLHPGACSNFSPADETAGCGQSPGTQPASSCFSLSKQNSRCHFLKITEQLRKQVFPPYPSLLPTPNGQKLALISSCHLPPHPHAIAPLLTRSPQLSELTSGRAGLPGLFLTAQIEAGIPLTFTLPHHYQLGASSSQAKKAPQRAEREGPGTKCQQLRTPASPGTVPPPAQSTAHWPQPDRALEEAETPHPATQPPA